MKRDNRIFQNFCAFTNVSSRGSAPVIHFKGKTIQLTKFEELEYVFSMEGRCMSFRSRGKMSSVLIRNIKYGAEQRVFVFNPRVIFTIG